VGIEFGNEKKIDLKDEHEPHVFDYWWNYWRREFPTRHWLVGLFWIKMLDDEEMLGCMYGSMWRWHTRVVIMVLFWVCP